MCEPFTAAAVRELDRPGSLYRFSIANYEPRNDALAHRARAALNHAVAAMGPDLFEQCHTPTI